jgi:hypothetical protein
MNIKFRSDFQLESVDLNLGPDYTVCFEVDNGDGVLFRTPSQEERETYRSPSPICTVSADRSLDPNVFPYVQDLHELRVPQGAENLQGWSQFIVGREPFDTQPVESGMPLNARVVVWRSLLPKSLAETIRNAEEEMFSLAQRAAKLMRWRLNIGGSRDLIARRGTGQWSLDGTLWLPMPFDFHVEMSVMGIRALTEDEKAFIARGLGARDSEPLSREILEEARSLSRANPKSSLIMAMVAAEVALKNFVSSKVLQAQWLIENMPSPPVANMAEAFVPELAGEALPNKLIEELRVATKLRNEIIHLGSAKLTAERLKTTLATVDELLRWLDAFSGHEWARSYLLK